MNIGGVEEVVLQLITKKCVALIKATHRKMK
jgi:hypothetical protein